MQLNITYNWRITETISIKLVQVGTKADGDYSVKSNQFAFDQVKSIFLISGSKLAGHMHLNPVFIHFLVIHFYIAASSDCKIYPDKKEKTKSAIAWNTLEKTA